MKSHPGYIHHSSPLTQQVNVKSAWVLDSGLPELMLHLTVVNCDLQRLGSQHLGPFTGDRGDTLFDGVPAPRGPTPGDL